MMKENWVYCRGDIYCAKLDPVVGSEQGGIRPVTVFALYCPASRSFCVPYFAFSF